MQSCLKRRKEEVQGKGKHKGEPWNMRKREKEAWQCMWCEKKFKTCDTLLAHIAKTHGGELFSGKARRLGECERSHAMLDLWKSEKCGVEDLHMVCS